MYMYILRLLKLTGLHIRHILSLQGSITAQSLLNVHVLTVLIDVLSAEKLLT